MKKKDKKEKKDKFKSKEEKIIEINLAKDKLQNLGLSTEIQGISEFYEICNDYINKDFTEYRAQLINYAQTYFPTTYTDFSETSPGMMFIEQAAYVGDVLSFYLDKLAHALIYFYLGYIGLFCRFRISPLTVTLLIFGFGLMVEIIHYYHPYRFFEYLDLLANLIGVTIAFLIFKIKNNISY